MMTYVEARSEERQRIGPEEIREWEKNMILINKKKNRYFLFRKFNMDVDISIFESYLQLSLGKQLD